MFTITETIEAIRHRQDAMRSMRAPQSISDFALGEVRIREQLREMVKGEMKYLTKGKRGAGKTKESILIRISNARRDHSASIRRQIEWGAS